jgi:hypothetical protein
MDQKPIILYLRMKGMDLDAIPDDLVHTLGKDAVAYSTVTKYLTALSFPAERKPPLPKLQMWNTVLSMRQYSRLLPNFRFRLYASFRGGSVFRDPPCTGTDTSRNRSASLHGATSSMGPQLFDGGTEADSGPDGNRTIAGPLGAKHAPVERHCHLGRIVDLFVQ